MESEGPATTKGGDLLPSPRSPLPGVHTVASASASARCAHSEKGESGVAGPAVTKPVPPSDRHPRSATAGSARCDIRTAICGADTDGVKRDTAAASSTGKASPHMPIGATAAVAEGAAVPPGSPASGGKADAGRAECDFAAAGGFSRGRGPGTRRAPSGCDAEEGGRADGVRARAAVHGYLRSWSGWLVATCRDAGMSSTRCGVRVVEGRGTRVVRGEEGKTRGCPATLLLPFPREDG